VGKRAQAEVLRGTLDLLVLKSLTLGATHGWGIGQWIQDRSEGRLEVNQGSLYPALQRLEHKGWIESDWGPSENNRRARYYTLTPLGRKYLASERANFDRYVQAIHRVLQTA